MKNIKVLVAKIFPDPKPLSEWDGFAAKYQSFIEIFPIPLKELSEQNIKHDGSHVISSVNSIHAIKYLNISGDFHVIGAKSKKALEDLGKNISTYALNAKDLCDQLAQKEKREYQYFCGNLRTSGLAEMLRNQGSTCQEVICYETKERSLALQEGFDAYVFFSPSGAASFFRKNKIPTQATIFAMGNTTADFIRTQSGRDVIVPPQAQVDDLFLTLKTYYDQER